MLMDTIVQGLMLIHTIIILTSLRLTVMDMDITSLITVLQEATPVHGTHPAILTVTIAMGSGTTQIIK